MNTKPSFWKAMTFIAIALAVALFIGYAIYTGEKVNHESICILQTYQI